MTKFPTPTMEDVLNHIQGDGVLGAEMRDLVRRAYLFAAEAHQGQLRKSGGPYIEHPLNVAYLLAEMHFDPAVVAAGFLHDVLEDCDVTREQLQEQFGHEVLVLVEGVTKLEQVEERVKQDSERVRDLQELESLRKLLIAMAEDDVRIIFIKLADRLHNMRTLSALSLKNQRRMARETLEIFAPVANRLGIWVWKAELEDLSFRYLNPEMYKDLAHILATRKDVREERVQKHIQLLEDALSQSSISAKIKGRPKHLYSIYRKMRRKHIPFSRVYDAEALRVIVETKAQCYQVLGIVHQLWTPVPGEFDDYVAHPKPNGYQSLHTAVIGEDGASLEIQIRTHEMNNFAEYGVAAHWRYKERGVSVSNWMMQQISTMRQSVQELTLDSGDARSFIDSIRSDVFQERVYVFTPKGRVIDLPVGATPLDFAYYVHTEIGHRCRGARVNGRWTQLDYQLQTGDQVAVITGRKGGPSRDWLSRESGFIKTNRAHQKIKQWFRRQSKEQNLSQGRIVVEKILKRLGMLYSLADVADFFKKHYQNLDDFLAAVGTGDLTGETIVNRLEAQAQQLAAETALLADFDEVDAPPPPLKESSKARINIRGTGGLLTHIGRCCKPLPGEEIVGYVTRGRGVTIHRCDCSNVLRMGPHDQERLIEVEWGTSDIQTFSVQVSIKAYDRFGLLHDMSGVIANLDVNMSAVSTGKRDRYNIVPVYMTLEIPDLATLTRVLVKLEQIPNIIEARRTG